MVKLGGNYSTFFPVIVSRYSNSVFLTPGAKSTHLYKDTLRTSILYPAEKLSALQRFSVE